MKAMSVGLPVILCLGMVMAQTILEVEPIAETVPIHVIGDYADDPAVWIHPDDAAQSVIIGTVKHTTQGGLYVYNLEEYIAGLNPTNADTFLIDSFEVSPETVLQWIARSGRVYRVGWSTNLLTDVWSCVASNLTVGAFTDTLHEAGQGCFRLGVGLAPVD